jgi:predicted RNase H-like nuclease
MQGSTFAPEPPKLYDLFSEVLDERPSFAAIVVNAPIGFRDSVDSSPRLCDVQARALLRHRGKFVHNAPSWEALIRGETLPEDHLDAVTAMLMPAYREVSKEMSPYRQRVVFEGNPELSFYQMNGEVPLRRSKKIEDGRDERTALLLKKVPGIEKVIDAQMEDVPMRNLLDAAALVATARRVFTRAAKRLPSDGVWDSQGLRMEFVY